MPMIRSLFAAVCLCALPSVLAAGQPESGKSPGGHVSYEIRPANDGKEIRVYRDDEKGRANKMCDTLGSPSLRLSFSPDDRWIIVQDGGAGKEVSEHRYAERLAWSADSRHLLVRVGGRGEERYNHVQFSGIGAYDLEGGKFGTDLGKFNQPGVRRWPSGSVVNDLPFIGAR